MNNSQKKDILLSNLSVTNNAVVGNSVVANNMAIRQGIRVSQLNAESILTDNFQLSKEPLEDSYILISDDMGNGTWGPASSISGNATGTGTTGRLTQWVDGPNSAIGDTVLSISDANISVNGQYPFSVTVPTGNIDLNASNCVSIQSTKSTSAEAIHLHSQSGGITCEAENQRLTLFAKSIDDNMGVLELKSSGVGEAAARIDALNGGIRFNYCTQMDIRALTPTGVTPIIKFGKYDAPDVIVDSGNLVITLKEKGLVHTNTGTVTQTSSYVMLNATSGKIQMTHTVSPMTTYTFTVSNVTVKNDKSLIFATAENFPVIVHISNIVTGSFDVNVTNNSTSIVATPTITFLVVNNTP